MPASLLVRAVKHVAQITRDAVQSCIELLVVACRLRMVRQGEAMPDANVLVQLVQPVCCLALLQN